MTVTCLLQTKMANLLGEARQTYVDSARLGSASKAGWKKLEAAVALLNKVLEIDPENEWSLKSLEQWRAVLDKDRKRTEIIELNKMMAKRDATAFDTYASSRAEPMIGQPCNVPPTEAYSAKALASAKGSLQGSLEEVPATIERHVGGGFVMVRFETDDEGRPRLGLKKPEIKVRHAPLLHATSRSHLT